MDCSTMTTLFKVKAVAIILSLLSLSVMFYKIERIINKEPKLEDEISNEEQENVMHVIMIMVTLLTISVNLLLYQGALDVDRIDLYFWPDPKYCIYTWLVVYGTLLLVYLYGMASCFWLASKGEKNGNIFVNENDNFIAWGFIYLAGDIIVILSIYFVRKWYSKL